MPCLSPGTLVHSLIPHRTCWVDDVCVGDLSTLAYAIAALVDLTSRRTRTNAKTENVCLRDRPSGRKLDNRDPTQCTPHLKHEAAGSFPKRLCIPGGGRKPVPSQFHPVSLRLDLPFPKGLRTS